MTRDLSAAGVSLEGDQAFEGGVQIQVSLFLVTEGIEDPSFRRSTCAARSPGVTSATAPARR